MNLQPGDIVRVRKLGNKNMTTYVLIDMPDPAFRTYMWLTCRRVKLYRDGSYVEMNPNRKRYILVEEAEIIEVIKANKEQAS